MFIKKILKIIIYIFRELEDIEIEVKNEFKLLIENVEVEIKKDLYIVNKPVKDGLLPDYFGIVISWNLEVCLRI